MGKINELGVTTGVTVVLMLITAIVVGAGVYLAAPEIVEPVEEVEVMPELKVGFVYVGPVGDFGWTYGHDRARGTLEEKYDWLETTTAEDIAEADLAGVIDAMFEDDADVVIPTSYGFGWETAAAAERWSDKILYLGAGGHPDIHGSAPNLGYAYVDYHEITYLHGLKAGALTETDKLGVILAFEMPEPIRAANTFALGAQKVNPDAEVRTVAIGDWYDPGAVATAFDTLKDWGADVILHTDDSPAAVETAQSHYDETGERIWVFSHWSPMKEFGEDVVLSGKLARWEELYEPLILKAQQGVVDNRINWGMIRDGAIEMGTTWGEPIHTEAIPKLEAVKIDDPVLGEINVYELVMKRYGQFGGSSTYYNIWEGPIYDSEGNLRLEDGEIIDEYKLNWEIDWYVEGVTPP